MKERLFPYIKWLGKIAGMQVYTQLTGQRLLLPFYHAISNERLPHIEYLYPVRNEKIFREDLDYILQRFIPIDFDELKALVEKGEPLGRNYVHLTFDDGLSQIAGVIAPVLKEKGIPATIFLNPAFIGNEDMFYRYKASLLICQYKKGITASQEKKIRELTDRFNLPRKSFVPDLLKLPYNNKDLLEDMAEILEVDFNAYLEDRQPYLTGSQVQDLAGQGFTFGAHSWDHPDYRELTLDEQLFQTRQSIAYVRDLLEVSEVPFAFPFTDDHVDEQFFHELHRKGPSPSLTFGTAGLKADLAPHHLHRIPMEGTLLPASTILRAEYLYYLLKAPLGKNVLHRKG